jgi:hypothetical protein
MKKCWRCKEEKDESEYGKNKNQKDGLWGYCKPCVSEMGKAERTKRPDYFREKSKQYREKNADKWKETCRKNYLKYQEEKKNQQRKYYWENQQEIRKKANKRNQTPEVRAKRKEYRQRTKERFSETHPAHKMVMYAIKLGLLMRPENCELCKKECRPEGHHNDYSKPLEVIWVCRQCHRNLEKKGELIWHK